MTLSLESGVEQRLESPDEGAVVRLIVGVDDTAEGAKEQFESVGAVVHDELPLNYYAIAIAEEELEELCNLDIVSSVELDSEGTVFNSDFLSPTG